MAKMYKKNPTALPDTEKKIARVYRRKNSRAKKALKFQTKKSKRYA